MADMKGFFEYAEEDGSIPDGNYLLEVSEATQDYWPDGAPRLDIRTSVDSGEYIGSFGPRQTWNIPREYSGEGFHVTEGEAKRRFSNQIKAVFAPDSPQLSNPTVFNEAMLRELASQMAGKKFYATVDKNKNGYPRIKRFYPLTEPPKGMDMVAGGFSVDTSDL